MKVLGKGKENLFNLLILSLSIIYSKFNLPFGRLFIGFSTLPSKTINNCFVRGSEVNKVNETRLSK